jgi:hypothetical protein
MPSLGEDNEIIEEREESTKWELEIMYRRRLLILPAMNISK